MKDKITSFRFKEEEFRWLKTNAEFYGISMKQFILKSIKYRKGKKIDSEII